MKKTTSLLFLLSFIFVVGAATVFAAGETTANPNVPGSGMINPNVTPNPNVPGSGMLPGVESSTNTASQGSALPTNSAGSFGNPLGNTNTIEAVLGNIMGYLQGIAGTIAVIFIIIGGIMYMISGGEKEMTERAKKTLIYAIAGLAIVLAAPLFYQEIKAVLSGNNPGSALQQLLMNILKLLLSIVGFLAIISMVVGAIWMLTAVGDDDRYELGKKTATYSILGLVIAVAALIIANQVTSLIGGGSSSVINNAANSSATGASTPTIPSSPVLPGTLTNPGATTNQTPNAPLPKAM